MKLYDEVAFNAVFWLLYFIYQWLGLASLYGDYDRYLINACMALPVSFLFAMLTVHLFFKRLYQQGKKAGFWMGIMLSSFLLLLVRRYINYHIIYPKYFPEALGMPLLSFGKLLVEFVNLYAITGLYALYYFIRYWYQERHRAQELSRQHTVAALELLKAQVQPHFVFNTLNNIYATALKTSPETAALISHLSGFLDYSLYDASKDEVPLTAEVSYIAHYIALQRNRYGRRLDAVMDVSGEINGLLIAPLLLLPLVENCFKHGVANSTGKNWICIGISRQPGELSVLIENSRDSDNQLMTGPEGGIGLSNVKKRLQLIYPGTHELNITERPDTYLVELKIKIQKNDQMSYSG